MKPELFAYLDYRKYLQDAFAALQGENPKISYRSVAKAAGYSSPNLLQLIIAGKRDLGSALLPGTARAFGLNKQEADFLADLAGFCNSQGFEEKNFHYQRMIRSKRYSATRPVEKGQFEYFDQWYHPVVRELLAHPDFDGSPGWIAARVRPRITEAQAGKSLELLLRLGLAGRNPSTGSWTQADARIETPAEVASLAVANYHRSLLRLASESIESFPPGERDIRAVTLGIPKSALPELKRRMEEFWRDLIACAEAEKGVEEVVQINLQLFPLTRTEGRQ